MIRSFIALNVRPTPGLKRLLAKLREQEGLRPVADDGMHLTLKFLGDLTDEALPEVCRAVARAAQGVTPFTVRYKGVGAFPNNERPSVMWIGLDDPEPVKALAARIEEELRPLGFPAEARPYSPHVTLLRFKNRPPEPVFVMLRDLAAADYGTDTIESIVCYQSELRRSGPEYVPLSTVKLTAKS